MASSTTTTASSASGQAVRWHPLDHVEVGFAARLQLYFVGRHLQREGALHGRNAQVQLASWQRPGAAGTPYSIALVIGARRRAHQIHLDIQVGDMAFFNGHFQGSGAILDLEAFGIQDAAAVDCQQAFGRAEGRLDQDLGDIAGLVGFLVGDQGDLFLFDLPGGGSCRRSPSG